MATSYHDDEFPDLQKALELSLALYETKAPLVKTIPIPNIQTAEKPDKTCSPSIVGPPQQGQDGAIIAIMGPCGTGKTSFINLVVGKEVGKVGHGLDYGQ